MTAPSPFVDTEWLSTHLSSPDVCVVDGSWHMPNDERNARVEFLQAHIPGAVYFDLDVIADTSLDLPHMVAEPQIFAKMVGELGIRESNTIIVYDSVGLFSAARVWWNFKIMGAKNCYVLEGGLPKWRAENRPVQQGESLQTHRPFVPNFEPKNVVSQNLMFDCVTRAGKEPPFQIVDVRSNMRFAGLEAEPREELRCGYMPSSLNLPFADIISEGQLIDADELRKRIDTAGIDLNKPIVSTCGSGVTAPILNLALAELGVQSMGVYDGSWTEWAKDNGLPVLGADGQPC